MARFQAQKKKQVATPQTKQKEDKKLFEVAGDDNDDDDDDLDDEDLEDSDDMLEEGDVVLGKGAAAAADDDDDDDEEDDDDDEDDEEDDDDDDEEIDAELTPRAANKKTPQNKNAAQAKGQTPKGAAKNNVSPAKTPKGKPEKKASPAKQTPKGQKTPANQKQTPKQQQSAAKKRPLEEDDDEEDDDDTESKKLKIDARDSRSLFVKGVKELTTQELKGLSSDILEVRRKGALTPFAFLEFKSEEIAEKHMDILQNKKVKNCTLVVDYVGEKSKNKKFNRPIEKPGAFNKTKLYIGGLPEGSTMADLKRAFPKALETFIPFNRRGGDKRGEKPRNFGFVTFASEDQAAEAYKNASNTVINNRLVTVLFARLKPDNKPNPAKKLNPKQNKKQEQPQQKKGKKQQPKKVEAKEEDDDDDDEDDVVDDDDDDDEEMSE